MKKLILTSEGFAGEVELIYGPDGKLIMIDMHNAELTDKQIQYMKALTPVQYVKEGFEEAFKSKTLVAVEVDYKVGFPRFWQAYNLKRNKGRCLNLWGRLSEADKVKAYFGVAQYTRYLRANPWQSKAQPEKYLRDRYWENDYK